MDTLLLRIYTIHRAPGELTPLRRPLVRTATQGRQEIVPSRFDQLGACVERNRAFNLARQRSPELPEYGA